MVPLEVIVRRRVTGSYLRRNPHLQEGAVLDPCVVEFTFKDDQQHDPLVTGTPSPFLLTFLTEVKAEEAT